METVLLLNPQIYMNELYDNEVGVFLSWCVNDREHVDCSMGDLFIPWEQLYTFQLFVREARKDE
jgi:hypothetical protein